MLRSERIFQNQDLPKNGDVPIAGWDIDVDLRFSVNDTCRNGTKFI
jgi:hypothetical protein